MKVLQINAVYKNGSTGRNIYEMHLEMRKRGIESYVAATHMKTKDKYCYQIGNQLDWKIHALLSRLTGLQGYYSKISTQNFINYIKRISPDIVHLNNVHANYLNLPLLFNYLANNNIATVITLHDCWFYTGKCTHYTTSQCYKWKTGCNKCSKLSEDNESWFWDRTKKMWNDKKKWYASIPRLAVVGVSDWIVNEAKKSILCNALKIERIYNWIDLDIFKPIKSEILGDLKNKFIILAVASNWSEKKGLNNFIQLGKVLQKNEIIVLVGKMPNIGLPDNIIHIDATNSVQELVQYYCKADVFLQLSMEESFGKVVAEALACGTPVVTVDSTANKELVDKDCGEVIESLEPMKVYDAVLKIKKKGKENYSDSCKRFAKSHFSKEMCIMKYIEIYRDLINIEEC